MTWLALRKFWPLLVLAIILGLFLFLTHRLETVKNQRDEQQFLAKQWQQSAGQWEASFHQAEANRKTEQQTAIDAVNASESSCDARIKAARDSAVKIEGIVNRATPVCKPGETLERKLADPNDLLDALGLRQAH